MEKELVVGAKGFERAKLAVEKKICFPNNSYIQNYPIETPNSFEIYSKQISESMKPTVKETIEYSNNKASDVQVYGSNALRKFT